MGATAITAVLADKSVEVPIELVAVVETLMYLSTSVDVKVYVDDVAPAIDVQVFASDSDVHLFHWYVTVALGVAT